MDIAIDLSKKKILGIPLMLTISCFPKFWQTHLFQFYKEINKYTLAHKYLVMLSKNL